MTDDERAALVDSAMNAYLDFFGWTGSELVKEWEAFALVLAAIEPAIRADERARVVEEATTLEAVDKALAVYWDDKPSWRVAMDAAIRAALGVATAPPPTP